MNLRGLGQNLELIQVELLVEVPAEKAGSLLIGDGNGVQMAQAVHPPLNPNLRKQLGFQGRGDQGNHLTADAAALQTDAAGARRLFQPAGRGHQLGSPDAERALSPAVPAVVRTEPKGAG